MNNSNEEKTAASNFVPPIPSCRKPLTRMTESQSRGKANRRYSTSPERDSDFKYDSSSNDEGYYISSDDNEVYEEEEKIVTRELSPCPQRKLYPTLESDGIRDRKSLHSQSNVESIQKSPKTFDETFNINSQNWKKSPLRIPESTVTSEELREILQSIKKNSKSKGDNEKKKKFSPKTCVACFFVFCLFVIILGFTLPNKVNSLIAPSKNLEITERLQNLRSDIKVIRNKFPAQDDNTWTLIQRGISEIIRRPQRPWMFVLFSNETRELECLAECLGKVSSKALLSSQSLSLKPKDMGDDHGIAIDRWRHEIKKRKAVVVHDLLGIDSGAIQAFHSMCDGENPLVQEAVYIMTIITKDFFPGVKSPEKFVADQLTNRFSNKLPEDKLQPLITRIIDGPIIPIRREVSLTGCEDCIR